MQAGVHSQLFVDAPVVFDIQVRFIGAIGPCRIAGYYMCRAGSVITLGSGRQKRMKYVVASEAHTVIFIGAPVEVGTEEPVVYIVFCFGSGVGLGSVSGLISFESQSYFMSEKYRVYAAVNSAVNSVLKR